MNFINRSEDLCATLRLEAPEEISLRTESLREITLARDLYRCGDHDGLGGQVLREYTTDLRGLFARHVLAVLKA